MTLAICTHHYLVGTPVDGIAPGRCKHCGATREFVDPDFAPNPRPAWMRTSLVVNKKAPRLGTRKEPTQTWA